LAVAPKSPPVSGAEVDLEAVRDRLPRQEPKRSDGVGEDLPLIDSIRAERPARVASGADRAASSVGRPAPMPEWVSIWHEAQQRRFDAPAAPVNRIAVPRQSR
jgi:hypothetical protein